MELSRPWVEKVQLSAYTIPADAQESDGTFEWDSTTLMPMEPTARNRLLLRALLGYGVTWFEEPVSSGLVPGLRRVRDRVPPGMDVAAGEYGYDPFISSICSKQKLSMSCNRVWENK